MKQIACVTCVGPRHMCRTSLTLNLYSIGYNAKHASLVSNVDIQTYCFTPVLQAEGGSSVHMVWLPLTLGLFVLQEVQVRSHATASCTRRGMLMVQSVLRSEEQASGLQPMHQYSPLCKVTSGPPDCPASRMTCDCSSFCTIFTA